MPCSNWRNMVTSLRKEGFRMFNEAAAAAAAEPDNYSTERYFSAWPLHVRRKKQPSE